MRQVSACIQQVDACVSSRQAIIGTKKTQEIDGFITRNFITIVVYSRDGKRAN